MKDAVEAIKRGATDFVTKPFQFDELLHALNSALEKRRMKAENAYLRSQLQERYKFDGSSAEAGDARVFQLLETVSSGRVHIVTGETGTGKEVVARAIHHNSPRRALRFVALNCGAIPETLLKPSSSATCAARLPARSARGRGASSRRTRARSSWMKSAR